MAREAMQALRVFKVFREFAGTWGRKETLAVKVRKVTEVLRALPVLWVLLARQDLREMPAPRVLEGFPVPQVPLAP